MARYIDDGTLILHSSFDQIMLGKHEIKMHYPSELEKNIWYQQNPNTIPRHLLRYRVFYFY